MRILMLAPHPFYSLRGTPIAERMLLEAVTAEGHKVDVLTYHEGEDPDIPGVKVHRILDIPGVHDVPPGFSWKKLACDVALTFEAVRLARQHEYDIVHAVEEAAFIGILLKRWRSIPFVYDMDSDLVNQTLDQVRVARPIASLLLRMEKRLIEESRAVLAVCRILEEQSREKSPNTLVFRVEDASLLDGLDGEADDLRSLTGSDGPIVLYVGNLQPVQGIDLLLEAFVGVARGHAEARLVVIGGSPERVQRYEKMADGLGVSGRVHFVGPRPLGELGGYLQQATILVSPRRGGVNTPMKIYSYLDSGRPLVATRLPTHTQVLDDSVCRLVDPEPDAVAHGVLDLLSDQALQKDLGVRASELAEREFTPEAFRRKIVDFYRGIERDLAGRFESSREESRSGSTPLTP